MDTDFTTLLLIVAGLLILGPALHAWIKVLDWWRGTAFDMSQYVTHAQLAAMKSDRDQQIKTTFELLTTKIDHLTETIDRLDQDLRQVRGDMPSLHGAIGRLEGHDEASRHPKRPR
jgi:hypothetical protein